MMLEIMLYNWLNFLISNKNVYYMLVYCEKKKYYIFFFYDILICNMYFYYLLGSLVNYMVLFLILLEI